MLVELIEHETRLYVIYVTVLKSYKYDSATKFGNVICFDYFKIYRLDFIIKVTDIIIILVFNLTTNVYDNQFLDLLYESKS